MELSRRQPTLLELPLPLLLLVFVFEVLWDELPDAVPLTRLVAVPPVPAAKGTLWQAAA